MSSATCCLRFGGELNSDLEKLDVNLNATNYRESGVPELVLQMFDSQNMECGFDLRNGRYLTALVVIRGNIATKEIDEQMLNIPKKLSYFIEWKPNNIKLSLCDVAPDKLKMSLAFINFVLSWR